MSRVGIVQLGRFGDIVSALPIAKHLHDQGHRVDWCVSEEFASILEAVSYVCPIPWPSDPHDLAAATRYMNGQKYDRVLVTQVHPNLDGFPKASNYQLQQWARAGMVERFHELPLIFDRCDAEQSVVDRFCPADDKPILGYALHGHSSPFEHGASMRRWIIETFGDTFNLLDFDAVRCAKPQHLLPLLERCAALLAIDTLHIHLAYATGTPTFALTQDETWYRSERRAHWIGQATYDEPMEVAGRRIVEAISQTIPVLNG